MHLIWSSEVKCVVTVWFLWSFWYILSNGVGDVTNRWRHFWFTSQHQSDLKYITHNSGSHYCFYYRSHQHTRTRNKNIYIAIKDYPQIRVWSYLPQVVHSFWERPIYIYIWFPQTSQLLEKHLKYSPNFPGLETRHLSSPQISKFWNWPNVPFPVHAVKKRSQEQKQGWGLVNQEHCTLELGHPWTRAAQTTALSRTSASGPLWGGPAISDHHIFSTTHNSNATVTQQ